MGKSRGTFLDGTYIYTFMYVVLVGVVVVVFFILHIYTVSYITSPSANQLQIETFSCKLPCSLLLCLFVCVDESVCFLSSNLPHDCCVTALTLNVLSIFSTEIYLHSIDHRQKCRHFLQGVFWSHSRCPGWDTEHCQRQYVGDWAPATQRGGEKEERWDTDTNLEEERDTETERERETGKKEKHCVWERHTAVKKGGCERERNGAQEHAKVTMNISQWRTQT